MTSALETRARGARARRVPRAGRGASAEAVSGHPGLVARVSEDALAAGGKRLRPTLAFLSSPPGADAAACARAPPSSSCTWRRSSTTTSSTARRSGAAAPAAWKEHGETGAKAAGDFLFARAFAVLAEEGDAGRSPSSRTRALALARGEAMQRLQRHDPDTRIEDYLQRCALKTGALFEAACVLGGGSGEFGLLLGVAFQIADDILDCEGETIETGKVPGTDLRDGTPTLPLLLAAQRGCRRARGARRRPAARERSFASPTTGALARSREVARDYARRAQASLDGTVRRAELEALAEAVVERSF